MPTTTRKQSTKPINPNQKQTKTKTKKNKNTKLSEQFQILID